MIVLNWIKILWGAITFKAWRDRLEAARRRLRYEEIRALIIARHMANFGGLVLPKKYDSKDLQSFPPPMYYLARNDKGQALIFWQRKLMTEEVGPPSPEAMKLRAAEDLICEAIATKAKADECH